jgi:cytoskeleton protein RodZ
LSLEQAALGAKLRKEVVAAIESNETQFIPQVYLNGHIRSYARYLGVSAADIEAHIQFAKGALPDVQSVFSSALPKSPDDRWFKATSYVLASVVVIALVWQFTTEAVRFSQGDPVLRSALQDSSDESIDGSGKAALNNGNVKPAPVKSHLQASIASLEEVDRTGPSISQSGAESAWSAISSAETETESVSLSVGAEIFSIKTSADSWIEIVDGAGKKIEFDLLRAGNARDYSAVGPVKLLLGRASAIELTHNGVSVDLAPHTRGNVARVILPEPAETMETEDSTLPESLPSQENDPVIEG